MEITDATKIAILLAKVDMKYKELYQRQLLLESLVATVTEQQRLAIERLEIAARGG